MSTRLRINKSEPKKDTLETQRKKTLEVPVSLAGIIIPEDALPPISQKDESKILEYGTQQSIKSYSIPNYHKCMQNEDLKMWREEISNSGLNSLIDCSLQVDPCRPYVDICCYFCRSMGLPCKEQRMWVWDDNK